jgi:hypothetical protein
MMISKRMRMIAVIGLIVFGARTASAQPGRRDESQLATAGTNTLVAVETPEQDGVKIYSIDEGTWSVYRAPKDTRTRPLAAGNFVVIMPEGPKITQLAAYGEPSKGWITLDLPEPAKGELWGPVLGPSMAVYVDGRRVYAFSTAASKWGTLELPEGAEPKPSVGPRVATVVHGDRLYIFNAKFGRWDDSGQKAK